MVLLRPQLVPQVVFFNIYMKHMIKDELSCLLVQKKIHIIYNLNNEKLDHFNIHLIANNKKNTLHITQISHDL